MERSQQVSTQQEEDLPLSGDQISYGSFGKPGRKVILDLLILTVLNIIIIPIVDARFHSQTMLVLVFFLSISCYFDALVAGIKGKFIRSPLGLSLAISLVPVFSYPTYLAFRKRLQTKEGNYKLHKLVIVVGAANFAVIGYYLFQLFAS